MAQDKAIIYSDLHLRTAKHLMDGVKRALGENLPYDDERAILSEYLQRNIYAFSAAKSFYQMQYYRDMMIGNDGKLLSYDAYKKRIADAGELFNNTHLRTEYQHAYQSAIMAHQWESLQTDYLEYSTVGDERVRPEHQALDKFTAPKNHPIWHKIYPPNGWACRCTVIPGKVHNSEKKMTVSEAGKMMKDYLKDTPFDNNVGISRLVFSDGHPYFQNTKGKIMNLSWEQYGLDNIEKIRADILPAYQATSKEEYFAWWTKQPKIKDTDDFVIKDVLGQEILLSSGQGKKGKPFEFFKDHILKKENEKRFEYGTETKNILTNPDEVWLNPRDKHSRIYIRYYEQGTIKLVVDDKLKAVTLYQIDNKHEGELSRTRKGILLYRK